MDQLPQWLETVGKIFPLYHMALGLQTTLSPNATGGGLDGENAVASAGSPGPARADSHGGENLPELSDPGPTATGVTSESYFPTVRLTLVPGASTLPGLGFCLITLACLPLRRSIVPTLQSARPRAFLAALSFFPFSLGTTQPS